MIGYDNGENPGAYSVLELVPEMLRNMRDRSGKTLREISEVTGLSVSFLSHLERGQTRPSLATLEKLATAYQQTITVDIPFRQAALVSEPPAGAGGSGAR